MAWPPLTFEIRPWTSAYPPGIASRAAMQAHRGPYEAAVVPTIADLPIDLAPATLAASTDAMAEVARFDAELGGEIAPFSAALLRSESASSSQIENLTASARAIAEAQLGRREGNARQVVGNVAAMNAAVAVADDLSSASNLAMHAALMGDIAPVIAGAWRSEQVWIGGSTLGPHQADFVPPHHERVQPAMADLVEFMARTDLPVLAQVAVAHAQFETIHPFPDGNGRTGRALMHAMLRHAGLVRNVTVPLSAGLLSELGGYFAALDSYRAGDVTPIVDRVTEATWAAVANGRRLVADLRSIRQGWQSMVTARRGARVWEVLPLLVRQPVVDAALVAEELGVTRTNVYRLLDALVEAQVLIASGAGERRTWRSPEVLAALDDFAARAGRRQRLP